MQDHELMSEIEEFVTVRTDFGYIKILQHLPKYKEVAGRGKQVLQEIRDLVADKDSNRLFDELEDITSALIGLNTDNAYLQGLRDGMKIQRLLG